MECIAKSGKSICCLCQRDVDIPEIYQHVLTNAIRLNEERKERDNLDVAIQIANENPPRLIELGPKLIRWQERINHLYSIDNVFEELYSINSASYNQLITSDGRSIEIANIMYRLKELAISSNIPLSQIFDAILSTDDN